jgi:hypothetical protein
VAALGQFVGRWSHFPDVRPTSIGGQRCRIAWASSKPSMEPGMSMSVSTIRMSDRPWRPEIASSASAACRTRSQPLQRFGPQRCGLRIRPRQSRERGSTPQAPARRPFASIRYPPPVVAHAKAVLSSCQLGPYRRQPGGHQGWPDLSPPEDLHSKGVKTLWRSLPTSAGPYGFTL